MSRVNITMEYSIISKSAMWSTKSLLKEVVAIINEKNQEGYEIVSVSFGLNLWWMPTAFITLRK
jgi:hypothetical protein